MIIPGIDDNYIISLLGKNRVYELAGAIRNGKTIIIGGPSGPTGKTTLWNELRKAGYSVVEKHNTYEVFLKDPVPSYKNHPIFRDAAKAFNIERDAYKSRIRYLELELARELVSKGMSIHDISQKLSISESVVRCVCEEDNDDQD